MERLFRRGNAPRGEELNEGALSGSDNLLIEVGVGELNGTSVNVRGDGKKGGNTEHRGGCSAGKVRVDATGQAAAGLTPIDGKRDLESRSEFNCSD